MTVKFNYLAHCTWRITCCLMRSLTAAHCVDSTQPVQCGVELGLFLFRNSTPRLSCIFIKLVGSPLWSVHVSHLELLFGLLWGRLYSINKIRICLWRIWQDAILKDRWANCCLDRRSTIELIAAAVNRFGAA